MKLDLTPCSRCTVTLKRKARAQAKAALVERGLLGAGSIFYGPDFLRANDGLYYSITDGWLIIRDGYTTYMYPLSDISRIKVEAV